jgi:phage-related holin
MLLKLDLILWHDIKCLQYNYVYIFCEEITQKTVLLSLTSIDTEGLTVRIVCFIKVSFDSRRCFDSHVKGVIIVIQICSNDTHCLILYCKIFVSFCLLLFYWCISWAQYKFIFLSKTVLCVYSSFFIFLYSFITLFST